MNGKKVVFGFFLVLLVCLVCGCSANKTFQPPQECIDQPSLILDNVPDPVLLSKSLLVVQAAALEKLSKYNAKDAMQVIDTIEDYLLSNDMTYAKLIAFVMKKIEIVNSRVGIAIFIMGDDVGALEKAIPISNCDKTLIAMHLARQKALIAFYE